MALTSVSTDAEVWQAYDDNAGYDIHGSEIQAGTFILACRILLRRRPKRHVVDGRGGQEIEFDDQAVKTELAEAVRWRRLRMARSCRFRQLGFNTEAY